jgi:type III pantothenate kinase
MILLDCGNSSIKAQCWKQGRIQASFACSYQSNWLHRLQHWLQLQSATQCYFASVLNSQRQAELDQCLAQEFANPITRFVSEAETLGVKNGYHQPARLGADRWMVLLAAAEITTGGALIIDAGSAMTIDLLRADGRHLGGAILPGINTSPEQFKRIFSHIDFDHPAIAETAVPGCSTEAAIQLDYRQHSIDLMPKLVNRWTQLLDDNASILLTGGDASQVQRGLDRASRIVPDLVFLGMRRLIAE